MYRIADFCRYGTGYSILEDSKLPHVNIFLMETFEHMLRTFFSIELRVAPELMGDAASLRYPTIAVN